MNFKKRVNGSWTDTSHYIHNTSTDAITTLPTVIYPTDTTATVGLKGQTLQSSIPSPTSPVMPQGTGERTGNVMPAGELKTVEVNGITFSSDGKGKYTINGTATAYASTRFNLLSAFTTPISVSNGGQGTLSFFNTSSDNNVTFVFYNGTTKVDDWKQTPIRRTSTAYNAIGNKYVDSVVITVNSGATVDITITPEFTNDGVLPETFEKFGYKIPISSANTTTPVYLGEVHTTRKVKKYECTGDENWRFFSDSTGEYGAWQFYVDNAVNGLALSSALSNIAEYGATASTRSRYPYGVYLVASGTGIAFQMAGAKDIFPGVTAWKFYLAQQYANGTPVTVWYVLANEETAVVNEPLRKIGDYADEVSGITIPTIAGANALSVDTTLQPSEVSVNYHGWHPVADVHEYDSNYTIATMQALTIAQLQTYTISDLQGGEWS